MKYLFKPLSYIAIIFINLLPINFLFLNADENKLDKINNTENNRNLKLSNFSQIEYFLDAGDTIEILFYEPEKLTNSVEIMANGKATIPLLGAVYLRDKTLESAKKIIEKKYREILIEPSFDIVLKKPRPIKITLIGELVSPGVYTLPFKMANPGNRVAGFSFQNSNFKYHPTIVDAIQIAGGINPDANLDNIEITRRTINENVNLPKTVNISLLDLFLEGAYLNNILLADGDIIRIEKRLTGNSENYKIINANLLPKVIPVYVVGEVKNPGLHNVPLNTTLIESILIAGGPLNARSNRSKVQLNRTLKNNFVKRENYNINYAKGNSKNTNPVLKENDIILVKSTNLAKVADTFNTITNPLRDVITIYTLIKIVED